MTNDCFAFWRAILYVFYTRDYSENPSQGSITTEVSHFNFDLHIA